MARVVVKVKEVPQPATTHPEIIVYFDGNGGGARSTVGWESPDAMAGLERMFGTHEDEVITSISITEQGITASFDKKRKEG